MICGRIGRSHIRKEQGKNKERIRKEQASLTDLLYQRKQHCLPQITQIYADKHQNSMNSSISTVWYLSLSARSAASALAEPFYPTCLLSAWICEICGRIGRSHVREEQGKNKERTSVPDRFIVSTWTVMSPADNADKQQTAKHHVSTISYMSFSAFSASSALADPFPQSVFYLRESA